MRYRRESPEGDYVFGQGDNTFLMDSPECVAQAVNTRLQLWRGEWFLDTSEGTPWAQSVLGKQATDIYALALRDRISTTQGVLSILEFGTSINPANRRVACNGTLDTLFGTSTLNSEA